MIVSLSQSYTIILLLYYDYYFLLLLFFHLFVRARHTYRTRSSRAAATACALYGPEGTPPGPTAWIHTHKLTTGSRARTHQYTHTFKPLLYVAPALRRDVSRIPSLESSHSLVCECVGRTIAPGEKFETQSRVFRLTSSSSFADSF